MKYQVMYLAAVFMAVVGVALLSSDTEAGHHRRGGNCCCSPHESQHCSGASYDSCHGGHAWHGQGCHGAVGCHGSVGCHGGMPMQGEIYYEDAVEQEGSAQDYAPPAPPKSPPSASTDQGSVKAVSTRNQFGFRTAQFVR